MDAPLRIAVLVKQVPVIEDLELGDDGRLRRDGLELHMNDYCRRGVAKGVELARATAGTCIAVTLGPPEAHTVLREAILCGADRGVHICDPAFAGSDTWATAKALAAALERIGPLDLVLCGRNSIDADTGQVPPQLAELTGLAFLAGARELSLVAGELSLRLEHDDEWVEAQVGLPALVSCAERLCDPCKIKDPAQWATVDPALIETLGAADLGPGPWGAAASPTRVGAVRTMEVVRRGLRVDSDPTAAAAEVAALLDEWGALAIADPERTVGAVAPPDPEARRTVVVTVEPDRGRLTRELLGAAADLGARVVAAGPDPGDHEALASWGADEVVTLRGSKVEEDLAAGLATVATHAWGLLAPGTAWGREVASRVAARLGAGLTGDAVELEARGDELVAWKPAFGGALVAEILTSTPLQAATVRAGALPLRTPRTGTAAAARTVEVAARSRVRVARRTRDDQSELLTAADFVIGVGQGLSPDDYPELDALAARLGAELCATRKVTDKGWMPRARQVGITGHSIAPRLYIGIGLSGKFNHTIGVRSAGTVVAVNPDRDAPIFAHADIGVVGDWRPVLTALTDRIEAAVAAATLAG